MSFGSGWESNVRRWAIAVSVRDIAAFRALSLVGLAFCGVGEDKGDSEIVSLATGLLFWASLSGMLVLSGSFRVTTVEPVSLLLRLGGLMSLNLGSPPAIDVSGIPEFRGGGGAGSRL